MPSCSFSICLESFSNFFRNLSCGLAFFLNLLNRESLSALTCLILALIPLIVANCSGLAISFKDFFLGKGAPRSGRLRLNSVDSNFLIADAIRLPVGVSLKVLIVILRFLPGPALPVTSRSDEASVTSTLSLAPVV